MFVLRVYSFHLIVRQLVCLSVCLFVRSFARTSVSSTFIVKVSLVAYVSVITDQKAPILDHSYPGGLVFTS